MRTHPRLSEVGYAAEVAVFNAGFFEGTGAEKVLCSAYKAFDVVVG